MEKRDEDKKARLLEALERGITLIQLDPRRPGVMVPKKFAAQPHLALNLSYRFDPPDLTVNDWGVRETLSFGGERFVVGVPWSAIYGIASHSAHRHFLFQEDMPDELKPDVLGTDDEPGPNRAQVEALLAEVAPKPAPKAVLREVVIDEATAASEPPTEPTPPKRGHLRIVK